METQTTELKVIDINAVEVFSDVRGQLEKLAEENERLAFDYRDPKGNKAARSQVYKLRTVKGSIEKERKRLKADAIAFGRRIDSAAGELETRVERMIAIHQEPLDRIENEERERLAGIQAAIDAIKAFEVADQSTSGGIQQSIVAITAMDIKPEVFQERMAEAVILRDRITETLKTLYAGRKAQEDAAAEAERQRVEAEAKARAEREERIAREAAEKARQEAEAKAAADAARRDAEVKAAEQRAAQAEQRAKDAQRQADERAKREAEAKAKAEADARAKAAADAEHVARCKDEAADAIEGATWMIRDEVENIIDLIASGRVPHVRMDYGGAA